MAAVLGACCVWGKLSQAKNVKSIIALYKTDSDWTLWPKVNVANRNEFVGVRAMIALQNLKLKYHPLYNSYFNWNWHSLYFNIVSITHTNLQVTSWDIALSFIWPAQYASIIDWGLLVLIYCRYWITLRPSVSKGYATSFN